MPLEIASKSLPSLMIKAALAVKTVDRAIGHIQSVMRVIMSKESLATEAQQAVNSAKPMIQSIKVDLVVPAINRIRLPQTPRHNLFDWGSTGMPAASRARHR